MILVSLALCLATAVFLCVMAGSSVISLYLGTATLGFFISWQFGSAFSWVAKKRNITGRLSSIFFIGCGFGGLVTPPVSGFFFTRFCKRYTELNNSMILCFLGLVLCQLSTSHWVTALCSACSFQ